METPERVATFHLYAQVIKRSAGRSAVRCAAYRAAETLHDERLGETYSYSHKQGVEHTEIIAPDGAPDWVRDRERLWNAAERAEYRRDAQPAREVRVALPVELSNEAQLELARAFVREEFVARGMVADFAIHRERSNNPHMHILLTMRRIGPDGFARTKERDWNRRKLVAHWREAWAYYANRALALEGHAARIDHRSYAARGIGLIPQPKLTTAPDADRDRREVTLERRRLWRETARRNGEIILNDPREALHALTSTQSTFTRTELLQFLNGKTYDAAQFERCLQAVLGHRDLVHLGVDDRGDERFSARNLLVAEKLLLDAGRELATRYQHQVRAAHVDEASAWRKLTSDQHHALEWITRATGDVAIVQGLAGTGKGYMLGAARRAWEAQGYTVVGGALAAVAAKGLQDPKAAGIPTNTLARWEMLWQHGRELLTSKHVFVIDEAGMVGTAQMARFLQHVRDAGAKIVLVGDTAQLKPIEAGEPMRVLQDELSAALLYDIRRQQVDWQKEATLDFAQGRAVEALRAYADHGLVHGHRDQGAAREALVTAWQRDRAADPTKTSLLLSYRRVDVRALNDAVRAVRAQAGELGQDHRVITRTRDGARVELLFADGDRIYFLQNDRTLGVANGSLGTITRIDGHTWTVRLDEGRTITVDTRTYDSLDHGYAATVHKGQGVTVDRAYVLASRPFDDAATYVAMTRHRESVELHWSHEEFRSSWAQPTWQGLESRAQTFAHPDEEQAREAALVAWRSALDAGDAPPLLLADTAEQVRALNERARHVARDAGRLAADDEWVRTRDGSKPFAHGDRVLLRETLRDQHVSAGAFGTIAAKAGALLHVELDDGRLVTVDSTTYHGLDHGYAARLEQSTSANAGRSIAVLTHELDERSRELLEGAHLGTLDVHGLHAPAPSVTAFFHAMARHADKERALDVQADLAEARAFAQIADLRARYRELSADDQPRYLDRLRRLGDKPALSTFEALRALPEVARAYATRDKAEDALRDALEYREVFQREARLGERVGDLITARTRLDVRTAERVRDQAVQRLDEVLQDPRNRTRAEEIAAERNRAKERAAQVWCELTEERERAARTERLARAIGALNARSKHELRPAHVGDFQRDLTYLGSLRLGKDDVVICRDANGTRVAFDARRFSSDLSAFQKGDHVRISSQFQVTRQERAQRRGRSL